MSRLIIQKKLTWDARFPYSFESIWSIFCKCIVLNNISLRQLVALISKDDQPFKSGENINFATSLWIDFDKFAFMLGVDKERLIAGTWEAMGINQTLQSGYAVRRCPECWSFGFHCALYDCSNISRCPIHGCKLTDPCVSCTMHSTFAARSSARVESARFCTRCRGILHGRSSLLEFLNYSDERSIAVYCRKLLHWWHQVGLKFSERDTLLSDILKVKNPKDSQRDYVDWQLGYACSLVDCSDFEWKFSVRPDAAFARILLSKPKIDATFEMLGDSEATKILDCNALGYRSLRRHLYRRYIRPHRRCYNQLRNLTREQCLSIDYDKVCLVSLAYLVWRLSIENLFLVEGLKVPRRRNFLLRMMMPNANSDIDFESKLRFSYFSFFGIWKKISSYRGVRNIRIERSGDYGDGAIFWKKIKNSSNLESQDSSGQKQGYSVLFPDMRHGAGVNFSECLNRNPGITCPVDQKWYPMTDSFFISSDQQSLRIREVLFELRNTAGNALNFRFFYINV